MGIIEPLQGSVYSLFYFFRGLHPRLIVFVPFRDRTIKLFFDYGESCDGLGTSPGLRGWVRA